MIAHNKLEMPLWAIIAQALDENHPRYRAVEIHKGTGTAVWNAWKEYVKGQQSQVQAELWSDLLRSQRDVKGGEAITDYLERLDVLTARMARQGETPAAGLLKDVMQRIGDEDNKLLGASEPAAVETVAELRARMTRLSHSLQKSKGGTAGGPIAMYSGGDSAAPNPDKGKTCRYCSKLNHTEKNCRKKAADNKRGGSGSGGGKGAAEKGKSGAACHRCGSLEHFIRNCPQPKPGGANVALEDGASADGASKDAKGKVAFAGVALAYQSGQAQTSLTVVGHCTLDSGASASMFENAVCFDDIRPAEELVMNANRELVPMVRGRGTARIHIKTKNGKEVELRVEDAKWAPGCWDLQSQRQLKAAGHWFTDLPGETFKWFLPNGDVVDTEPRGGVNVCKYKPAGRGGLTNNSAACAVILERPIALAAWPEDKLMSAARGGMTYVSNVKGAGEAPLARPRARAIKADLWHERLNHVNLRDCVAISKAVDGMTVRGAADILGTESDEEIGARRLE